MGTEFYEVRMTEYEEIEYLRGRLKDKDTEIARLTDLLVQVRRGLAEISAGLQTLKSTPSVPVQSHEPKGETD